jgi:hypothetical protein
VKRFWQTLVTVQAITLIVFCVAAARSSYFSRMPASVRHGSSIESLIAGRAVMLAIVFATFDSSVALWIAGRARFDASARAAGVIFTTLSIALFLTSCALFAAFVLIGFAQY